MDDINKESSSFNSFFINSKSPFSSDIIPLLLEKETVANGIGAKEMESKILTDVDWAFKLTANNKNYKSFHD